MALTTTGASGDSEKKLVPPHGRYAPASPGMSSNLYITSASASLRLKLGLPPRPFSKGKEPEEDTQQSQGPPVSPGMPSNLSPVSFCLSFSHYCSEVLLLTS